MKGTSEHGFTLIEVLIAMVIFAVGLLGLEALGMTAARSVAQANLRSEYVTLVADSLESALHQLRAASTSGALPPAPFCEELERGAFLRRTINYGNQSAPFVTVTVIPATGEFVSMSAPITVASTVYLSSPVNGAETIAC